MELICRDRNPEGLLPGEEQAVKGCFRTGTFYGSYLASSLALMQAYAQAILARIGTEALEQVNVIAGYSAAGGVLCYEMARQLHEQGIHVLPIIAPHMSHGVASFSTAFGGAESDLTGKNVLAVGIALTPEYNSGFGCFLKEISKLGGTVVATAAVVNIPLPLRTYSISQGDRPAPEVDVCLFELAIGLDELPVWLQPKMTPAVVDRLAAEV